MIEETIKQGKKSLDSLLKEKAYQQVEEHLVEICVDINEVAEEDIEALVVAKMQDMQNTLKGAAMGSAFMLVLSSLI